MRQMNDLLELGDRVLVNCEHSYQAVIEGFGNDDQVHIKVVNSDAANGSRTTAPANVLTLLEKRIDSYFIGIDLARGSDWTEEIAIERTNHSDERNMVMPIDAVREAFEAEYIKVQAQCCVALLSVGTPLKFWRGDRYNNAEIQTAFDMFKARQAEVDQLTHENFKLIKANAEVAHINMDYLFEKIDLQEQVKDQHDIIYNLQSKLRVVDLEKSVEESKNALSTFNYQPLQTNEKSIDKSLMLLFLIIGSFVIYMLKGG